MNQPNPGHRGAVMAVAMALAGLLPAACTGQAGGPPTAAVPAVATAGPQGGADPQSGRELWLVPSQRPGLLMRAYLVRPPGEGPFRLAVINHGSETDPGRRAVLGMPTFDKLTAWFVAHGYAVLLPQRPGHGQTGGPYLEDEGICEFANYTRAGDATADSIAAAIGYMTKQPFIRPHGVVALGNSAGGWGVVALASRNPPAVSAVISLSGGRGGHNGGRALHNCAPNRLVSAAGDYGRTARVPSLWLYASNDTYFPPALSRRMADAFKAAGGTLEYHVLPPVGSEGHTLAIDSTAWAPYIAAFLKP
jgi:dienelactone hydrolase